MKGRVLKQDCLMLWYDLREGGVKRMDPLKLTKIIRMQVA